MRCDEVRYTTAAGPVTVVVGGGMELLSSFSPIDKTIIIADENVYQFHAERFPDTPRIVIRFDEAHKTLSTVEHIYKKLLEFGVDRFTRIAVVGGGIASDTGGYAASTFMRGLKFGFVSTTLLSQVDASVGGKNGVNYDGYKNIIGTITQPEFVLCDTSMLSTLPDAEYATGAAEIIKAAFIADAEMIGYLRNNTGRFLARNEEVLHHLVLRSVQIKADVVERDEHENSVRRTLNFGHTLAHALEKCVKISHGEAVAAGMVFAAEISLRRGLVSSDVVNDLTAIIRAVNLPVSASALGADKAALKEALLRDKKRQSGSIHFALLDAPGSCRIEMIPLAEVEAYIDALC